MLKDKDSKQSIQVTVRVRPTSQKQQNQDSRICVKVEQNHTLQVLYGNDVKKFAFDSICYSSSQQQIFEKLGRKCTLDCLQGYNCTIFAYGQTGAGKTYTMMGVSFQHENYYENRGLIPRSMEFLFECIEKQRQNGINFIIRCSFLEIYNEQIIDLLNKSNNNLQLREDTRKGVYVEGISQQNITRSEQAMQILYKGSKSRHIGSTLLNETSSRSHSVFTLIIQSKYTKNGVSNTKSRQFNFIDLAGSQRTKQSTGERLKEGCNINKSLMNLATVINALSEVSEGKAQHVNYRNSKLTFLLKDSLGGNSKTTLIANISPATMFYQQTISTLGFARRAKLIKREKASINEDSTGNLQSMKNEIKRLKQQVITLMTQYQANSPISNLNEHQKPSEMTSLMHQYVSQQIDKQTKLQLEILKLNDRILHLQKGIKQYSNNEIHLRMIISVYEDKSNRLKNVQKLISKYIENIDENDEPTQVIIQYFKNQRNNFMNQLKTLRTEVQSNRFLKELMRQAKILREDGEDENLKELLMKNTFFLSKIQTKLDDMKPEKIQAETHSSLEAKIQVLNMQHLQREQQLQQRLEQANLELSDFKTRNEQGQKMLEQAINAQISLEKTVKHEIQTNKKLHKQLEQMREEKETLSKVIEHNQSKSIIVINELKAEIETKQVQILTFSKEIETLKVKLNKSYINESSLKEQFEKLEQQKIILDNILIQNSEELKQSKSNLITFETQVTSLRLKLEMLDSENTKLRQEIINIKDSNTEKGKKYQQKLTLIENKHIKQIQSKMTELSSAINQIKSLEESIKNITQQLFNEKKLYENAINQLEKNQQQYRSTLFNNEQKMKELIALVNQKELNGNQTAISLQQVKLQLINAHSQKDAIEAKYLQAIQQLKKEILKEEIYSEKAISEAKLKDSLNQSLNHSFLQKEKECFSLSANIEKIIQKVNILEQSLKDYEENKQKLSQQLEQTKNIQKDQKLEIIQLKKQLSLSLKHTDLSLNALNEQIHLKDNKIDSLQQQVANSKNYYEQKIEQLKKQIENSNEENQNEIERMKKIMQTQIMSKENIISQINQQMIQREKIIKELQQNRSNQYEKSHKINEDVTTYQQNAKVLKQQLQELTEHSQTLKLELNELRLKYQRDRIESQATHCDQIDRKNEQIESFMIQNNALALQIKELNGQLETLRTLNNKLVNEINSKHSNYKQMLEMNNNAQKELCLIKSEFQTYVKRHNKQKELIEINNRQISQKMNKIMNEKEELQFKILQFNTNCQNKHVYRQQMQKQIEYYTLQNEKTNLEACNYVKIIEAFTSEVDGLNQRVTELSIQKNQQQQQLERLTETEKNHSNEKQVEIEKLTENNKNLMEKLENNSITATQKIKQLTEQIERKQIEASHIGEINIALEENLKNFTGSDEAENINKANEKIKKITLLMEQQKQKTKELDKVNLKNQFLKDQNKKQATEINDVSKLIKELSIENCAFKQKLNKYESYHQKLNKQVQDLHTYKQKWELQINESQKIKNQIEQVKVVNDRLLNELCRQKEINSNFKLLTENKTNQILQLQQQLQEKETVYKKLVDKIAKNQSQQRKNTNSEHYLKTIELLEKSRTEQIQLRRQNEQLKKVMLTMKETIEQKQAYSREVELRSESYSVSMRKKMDEIQKQYTQLERNHQKLIKERKFYQKFTHDNELLKEEVQNLKVNASKIAQKNQEMEGKIKKANLDSIKLEKEYEQIKKGGDLSISKNTDERTVYINRLKAEIATLKTQKVLLNETLNKERDDKMKLKTQLRYGKEGITQSPTRVELQKKNNENKNLTQLIFEIVSQLKICVNEPKAKLQVIRSMILNSIREKNTQIKNLKQKLKSQEAQHYRPMKIQYSLHRQHLEHKNLNTTVKNVPSEEVQYKYEKDHNYLNSNSRQKIKEFQKYYAKFKYNLDENRGKNV